MIRKRITEEEYYIDSKKGIFFCEKNGVVLVKAIYHSGEVIRNVLSKEDASTWLAKHEKSFL